MLKCRFIKLKQAFVLRFTKRMIELLNDGITELRNQICMQRLFAGGRKKMSKVRCQKSNEIYFLFSRSKISRAKRS